MLSLDSTSYFGGFADGQIAPLPSPEIIYSPAITYYIDSVRGNDWGGKGTPDVPYSTFARASKEADSYQAHFPDALVSLALKCGNPPCMESVGGKNIRNRLYTCWGQSHLEDMANMGGNAPFVFIAGGQNVAIKGLSIRATDPNQINNQNGILCNGPTGLTVTFCDITGYGINISFIGTGKAQELTVQHNYIADSWLPIVPAPANGRDWRSQGLYTTNASNPVVTDNSFCRNGYRFRDIVMKNPQTWAQFQFSHGWYAHEGGGPNVDARNIYWANACNGPMLRMGGNLAWGVLAYNGNAADVLGGGMGCNAQAFSMTDSVILGFPASYNPDIFPGWGGGVEVGAQNVSLSRLLFLSNNTNYGHGFPPSPILAHNPPAAVFATLNLNEITGIWPNAFLVNNPKGDYTITGTPTIRLPKVTDVLPDMLGFTSAANEDAGMEVLRLNKHNARFGAVAGVNYFRRAAAGIL